MRGYLGCCQARLAVVGNILVAHRTGLTSRLFDVGIQAAALVRELLGVPGYKGQNGTRRLTYVCEGWMSSSLLSSEMCELNPLQVYECLRHPLRFYGVELRLCCWAHFPATCAQRGSTVQHRSIYCAGCAAAVRRARRTYSTSPRLVVHLHLSHALKTS